MDGLFINLLEVLRTSQFYAVWLVLMRDLSHSFSKRSLFSKTTNSLNHLLKLCQLLCQLISSFSIVPKNVGKLTLSKLALALTSLSIFLFRFFGGLRGSTVPWTCFIVIV